MTIGEKKNWIKQHWNGFSGKKLAYVLNRYFTQAHAEQIETAKKEKKIREEVTSLHRIKFNKPPEPVVDIITAATELFSN